MNHNLSSIILLLVVTGEAKLMVVLFCHYHNIGGKIAVSTQLSVLYYGNSKGKIYSGRRLASCYDIQTILVHVNTNTSQLCEKFQK